MRSTIVKNGTVRLAPTTNMRLTWRTCAGLLGSGPTMKPGRVAQEQHRQVERVAQLHEARRLVGAVAVDRAAEVHRVVGDDAERPPLDAGERGDHAGAEPAAQLEHRIGVGTARRSRRARRRRAGGSRGRACAAPRWSAHAHSVEPRPGSRTGTAWRRATASASSATRDVDHAVGHLHVDRADSSGANTPRPPPSIIAGPPMPMFEPSVAMITSQQPSSAALPAKQRPDTMPTSGTSPLSSANRANAMQSRPDTPGRRCRPGARRRLRRTTRPAAAAARPARTAGPSCGGSAGPGCRRARCSRTTSTIGRAGRRRVPTPPTRPSAGVRAIELVERRGGAAARRSTSGAVLDEAARVARGRRRSRAPCAGRGLRRRSTASGRRSSSPTRWRSRDLGEVGPDRVEVDVAAAAAATAPGRRPARRRRASSPGIDGVARRDRDARAPSRPTRPSTTCSIFIDSSTRVLAGAHRVALGRRRSRRSCPASVATGCIRSV